MDVAESRPAGDLPWGAKISQDGGAGRTRWRDGSREALKVLHLAASDVSGGAARAAFRLHQGLRQLGQESSMLVDYRYSDDPNVLALERSRNLKERLRRRTRREAIRRSLQKYAPSRPAGGNYFSDDRSDVGWDLLRQLPDCEIVNLHWVAGLVDYGSLFKDLPGRKPLVWTVHDTNPFTGGCHYYGPCRRFKDRCGACPELGSSADSDLSRAVWQRKKAAFSHVPAGRLHVITPSRWMAGQAGESSLLGHFPISVIPYGLDTEVFCPRDRTMARDVMGIPRDGRVLLFAADSIEDHRKGYKLLGEALAPIPADAGIHLTSVGRNTPALNLRLPYQNLGFFTNDRILSLAYNAADIYVTPTLDDNLPNTVMEAMACGTPVVAFETGGVPEMVRNGVTGFVVPAGNTGALREAILRVLNDDGLRSELSRNCRRIAQEEYGLKLQARRYLSLYESITSR